MKRLGKLAAVIVAALLVAAALAGCNRKNYVNDENTVVIAFYEGGYGREFIDKMAEEFKAANPGKNVAIKARTERNMIIETDLKSGPEASDADLIVTNGGAYDLLGKGKYMGFGHDYIFEPLTDVYDYVAPGQTRSIRERTMQSYYPLSTFKDTEFLMLWSSGIQGLIYHADQFAGKQIPRTTNELIDVAGTFADNTAFIYSGYEDYWNALHLVWWAQYEGAENYFDFYKGLAEERDLATGETVKKLSNKIFEQRGRLEALKVMETLLDPNNNYCYGSSTGTSIFDAQLMFMRGDYAMHPNGDWIENETKDNVASDDIRFMKTPVVSSLGTKLGITESELTATIDYVDGIAEEKPVYAAADAQAKRDEIVERVAEARNMIYLSATTHFVGIPSYSNAIPLAKEFLKFMYSDRGVQIFAETTGGATLPIDYDYQADTELWAKFSEFQRSRLAIMNKEAVGIYQDGRQPLCYLGNMRPYSYNNGNGNLEAHFGATNPADRKTALDFINFDINNYSGSGWDALLQAAGYLK